MSEAHFSVGVVGCGGIGRAHAEAYAAHDDTEIVAAADMDEDTLESFAAEYDVPATYGDHEAMAGAEDLDLVSVCTWHATHAEITIDVAEAGVPGIFCEKPMCTSLGEAEDMVDAARRNDAKLTIGHQRRFDPVHETAKELIADGAIGEPNSITSSHSAGLLNWGTHLIDLGRYFLDDPDPEWVMGQVERRTDRHERLEPIEDRCLLHACFEDGTRLTYESDMPDPDFGDTTLQVQGSEGVLRLDLGSRVEVVNADGRQEYAPTMESSNRLAYVDAHLEWLAGDSDGHRCSASAAKPTIDVMMAAYESLRTRGVVDMPLETRANPLELMIESGDLPVETPGAYDIRIPYASLREDE